MATDPTRIKTIHDELQRRFPSTHTFLNYETDWQLLFAIMLSAQATDKAVNTATSKLFRDFPTLDTYTEDRAEEIFRDIQTLGLGKSKTRYLIQGAKVLREEFQGAVPKDRKAIMTIPGCAYKTSGVFLAEYYHEVLIPVDTHVQRVAIRLGLVKKTSTPEETEKRLEKLFHGYSGIDTHRQLILFGRTVCHALRPECSVCPFASFCRHLKSHS